MKVLIYCSGINIELRPFTDMMPKCLLPINGKPILKHNLEWLEKFDVDGIVITSSYRYSMIDLFLNKIKTKIPIHFHRQPKILGSSKTLINLDYKFSDKPFVYLQGDNLYDFDLDYYYDKHLKSSKMISIFSHNGKGDIKNKNIIKMKEDNSELVDKIIVKPNHYSEYELTLSTGAFIANPTMFSKVLDKEYDLFNDSLPRLVDNMTNFCDNNVSVFNNSNEYMRKSNTWSNYDFIHY